MKKRILVTVAVVLSVACACLVATGAPHSTQGAGRAGEWKAVMRMIEFGYGSETMEFEYDYKIYQNAQDIVRRELTYSSLNPISELGRDVHLIDFRHGVVLAFNRHASKALKYQIEEPGARSPLGERRILGHLCKGTRYELDHGNGSVHVSEQWVMADGGFKEPLLRVEYNLARDKSLLTLSVAVVTRLESATGLPADLFAAPGGLQIIDTRPRPPY